MVFRLQPAVRQCYIVLPFVNLKNRRSAPFQDSFYFLSVHEEPVLFPSLRVLLLWHQGAIGRDEGTQTRYFGAIFLEGSI